MMAFESYIIVYYRILYIYILYILYMQYCTVRTVLPAQWYSTVLVGSSLVYYYQN